MLEFLYSLYFFLNISLFRGPKFSLMNSSSSSSHLFLDIHLPIIIFFLKLSFLRSSIIFSLTSLAYIKISEINFILPFSASTMLIFEFESFFCFFIINFNLSFSNSSNFYFFNALR